MPENRFQPCAGTVLRLFVIDENLPEKVVNANRLQVHELAYNLFNWFRWQVLPARMKKQQVDTIRLKAAPLLE